MKMTRLTQLGAVTAVATLAGTWSSDAPAAPSLVVRNPGVTVSQLVAAPVVAHHGLSAAEYQQKFNDLAAQGFRITQVSGYVEGGSVKYAALWKKTSGPELVAHHGLSAADYQAKFDAYTKQGYRLTYVSGYEVGGHDQYAAIWEKQSGGAWTARHGLSADDYQKTVDQLSKEGFRIAHVSGYEVGGAARFAAIFEKGGPLTIARHGLSPDAYQKAFDEYGQQGYRIVSVSGYHVGSSDYYAAIWEKVSGPYMSARHGIPVAHYQNVFENHITQGYVPSFVSAFSSGNSARVNAIFENTNFKAADLDFINKKVQNYLAATNAPGVSIALAKDGKLVYAAGFGLANKETGEAVGSKSRFRIASVSKPITSIVIMHLVEQNPGLLDKKVFGPNSLLGAKYPTPSKYPDLEKIKVRHLLSHVAGFSSVPGVGDPMFQHTDYDHDKLIKWALSNGVQVRAPEKQYEYSNFGYCLLGRIIETLTNKSYEAYVKEFLLKPAGANGMELGANSAAARKPYEVTYYPSGAYDLNVTRFDAHGGWIATPSDLLRVLVRADGLGTKPDFISGTSYSSMLTATHILDASSKDPNYAFGWGVGGGMQAHNGAMSGTVGIMVRAAGGWTYAGLVNTRPSADQWAGSLSTMLGEIAAGVSKWPSYDLF